MYARAHMCLWIDISSVCCEMTRIESDSMRILYVQQGRCKRDECGEMEWHWGT